MGEISEKLIDEIEKILKDLFSKMGFEAEISPKIIDIEGKESVCFNVKTSEANILIGQGGANLQAMQHLARILVRHKTDEIVNFTIDINEYKQGRERYLRSLARELARRVERTNDRVVLKPMTSYERRIIHTALASEDRIETLSEGDEPERRVIIRPIKGTSRSLEEKIDTDIV